MIVDLIHKNTHKIPKKIGDNSVKVYKFHIWKKLDEIRLVCKNAWKNIDEGEINSEV